MKFSCTTGGYIFSPLRGLIQDMAVGHVVSVNRFLAPFVVRKSPLQTENSIICKSFMRLHGQKITLNTWNNLPSDLHEITDINTCKKRHYPGLAPSGTSNKNHSKCVQLHATVAPYIEIYSGNNLHDICQHNCHIHYSYILSPSRRGCT